MVGEWRALESAGGQGQDPASFVPLLDSKCEDSPISSSIKALMSMEGKGLEDKLPSLPL